MSIIVGNINTHHSRLETNTNEDERGEQAADEIDAPDYSIKSIPPTTPSNQYPRLLHQINTPTTPSNQYPRLLHQINTPDYSIKSIAPTTPFTTTMTLRGYRQIAGQLRPTSVWPPLKSHYCQTGQFPPQWPAIICSSLTPSSQNCPRLMGLGKRTSTSRKRTGRVVLNTDTTDTLLKLKNQELSNKLRGSSGKQ